MKDKIKTFVTGIKNIWRWRKVLYRDRDWDHWYIYEILKTKLKFQADYIAVNSYHERAGEDVKEIRECIELIDKVQNEFYIDEMLNLDQSEWTLDRIKGAEDSHNQTKRQLFKLLDKNIEHWWS